VRFTALEEYGLRCMLQFARHARAAEDGVAAGKSLTIGEIAEIEGLTPQYAGKLIRILRMGGLLESARGCHGGFRLARTLDQISLAEVLAVLGGRVFEPQYCSRYTGELKMCVHSADCTVRSLWRALQSTVDGLLEKVMLKDLIGTETGVAQRIDSLTESIGVGSFAPSVSTEVSATTSGLPVEKTREQSSTLVTLNALPIQAAAPDGAPSLAAPRGRGARRGKRAGGKASTGTERDSRRG